MNVRIYQINMKRDANNVAFMNYESLPKFQGSSEIDSSLYDKVFEGEVNCFTLEKLYEIFNLKHPAGYKGRSMSVSDVVEVIDGNTGKSYFHFCDSFGFQKVDFDPEKTQVSDRFLSLAEQEKISVLLVPVGKSPIVKEIPNTYEAVSYTNLRAHETLTSISYAVFCLKKIFFNDTATTEIYTLELSSAASDVYKRQHDECLL